jgi:hypothetical protein
VNAKRSHTRDDQRIHVHDCFGGRPVAAIEDQKAAVIISKWTGENELPLLVELLQMRCMLCDQVRGDDLFLNRDQVDGVIRWGRYDSRYFLSAALIFMNTPICSKRIGTAT